MFGRIWNFIKRHKKKFLFTGVVFGGLVFVGGYVRKKLLEIQKEEAKELLNIIRKKRHFEVSQRTCLQTIESLIPSLKNVISSHIQTEHLTEQLKKKPPQTIKIWQQLKINSFVRTLTSLYAISMLTTMLKVHLNLVSAYMFHNTSREDGEVDERIKQKYTDEITYFLDEGILHLIHSVDKAVVQVVGEVSLTKEVTYDEVMDLLNCVRRKVEMKKSNGYHDSCMVGMSQFMFRSADQLEDVNEDFIHIDKSDAVVGSDVGAGGDDGSVRGDEYAESEVACACIRNNLLTLVNSSDFSETFSSCLDTSFHFMGQRLQSYFHQSSRPLPMARVVPVVDGLIQSILYSPNNKLVKTLLSNLDPLACLIFEQSQTMHA